MIAITGQVSGNAVIVHDRDISRYDGRQVIVTILDGGLKFPTSRRNIDDMMDLVTITDLSNGNAADEYIKELRGNDRL